MAIQTYLAARLFDGTGAAEINDAFVQIDDSTGTIANVGKRAELGSAASAARDLGDATVLPGLINMHTHLTLSGRMQVFQDALNDTYEVKLMRAVEHARQSIESGVTTIRDCGTHNPIVFAIREASQAGLIAGPHVWASGDVLTSTGGHCYFFGLECDTLDDVRKAVRGQVKAGADFIKVMATGGGITPNTNTNAAQFDRQQMIALVQDAERLGRYVAAHCHGTPGIHNAIAANVRTIEHCTFSTPAGIEYDAQSAHQMAEQGIYVCPTLGAGARMIDQLRRDGVEMPWMATMETRNDNLRRLHDAGVEFVSGNDAGVTMSGFDDFQLDLELLVELIGLSAPEAIATATSKAAAAIGSSDFGVLAPGKRADILAVRGNALDDISALRNVQLVLKAGKVMRDA
jgi:imidazolonepropionase-like amidohydrolase